MISGAGVSSWPEMNGKKEIPEESDQGSNEILVGEEQGGG